MEVRVLRFAAVGGAVAGLALTLATGVGHAQGGSPAPGDLIKDPAVKAALEAVKANEAQTIEDQIRFCEIPAPSFKEDVRGQELKRTFEKRGDHWIPKPADPED